MDVVMDRVTAVETAAARQLLDDTLSVVVYDLTTIRILGEEQVKCPLLGSSQPRPVARTGCGAARATSVHHAKLAMA